jgi:quercetin dioxygenase-like cupin family protein
MMNSYKNHPFEHKKLGENQYIRKFAGNIDKDELVWHRDMENREIEILSGQGWKFQRENCLPITIKKGSKILIKKNEWHRIIKGNSDLIIKIKVIDI